MLTFLLAGLAFCALGATALSAYSRVAYCEYLLFSTCPNEELPKHIFPLARRRDYRRIAIGSKSRKYVITTTFVSNLLVTISFVLILMILVLLTVSVFTVIVLTFAFAVVNIIMWRSTVWGMPRDRNTIYL